MNQACRKRHVFVSRSQKSTFFTQWRIKAGQLPTCHDAIIVSRLAARAERDVLRSSSKTRCIVSNMFCEHESKPRIKSVVLLRRRTNHPSPCCIALEILRFCCNEGSIRDEIPDLLFTNLF